MVLRDRTRLVIGSFGLGLVLCGVVIFLGQMYRAIETGRLEGIPVRVLLDEPIVRQVVPASVGAWFERLSIATDTQGLVTWLLDEVPLALVLAVVGGLAAWWNLLWEAPASRRR